MLTGLVLMGIVDQIDGGVALVEWEGEAFGTVDLDVLPADLREGDAVRVRVPRRHLRVRDAGHERLWLAVDIDDDALFSTRVHRTHQRRSRP